MASNFAPPVVARSSISATVSFAEGSLDAANILKPALSRGELQVIGESHDGHAFHCFMVAPEWADKREAIQQILCGMHLDPSGQKVLDDLKFKGFEPIGDEIIPVLAKLTGG